ncbi:hypothetical protein M1146_06385 [Patescibacteria group bacterium]|nr:hypothetical protein [Patescibacteria group bacterium]
MQLFGLINALLEADDGAQKRHLSIQTFSIIPLSADSGYLNHLGFLFCFVAYFVRPLVKH